jgi:hypothetical protein
MSSSKKEKHGLIRRTKIMTAIIILHKRRKSNLSKDIV